MPRFRLNFENLYADVIRDRHDSSIWIYVVQRHGSPDVLAMGSCSSIEQAENVAWRIMKQLPQDASSAAAS